MTGPAGAHRRWSDLVDLADPGLSAALDEVRRVAVGPDPDGTVAEHRRRILELGAARPDLARRTCRPGHLTGSAFVLDATGSATLLLFHRKLQRWLQPGGHADGDHLLVRVALREAIEETGLTDLRIDPVPLDLDVHEVAPPAEDAHLHLDVRYLVVAPPGAAAVGNHESEAVRWVPLDELAETGADAGILRMARRAAERLGR